MDNAFCIFIVSHITGRDIVETVYANADTIWRDCKWPRKVGYAAAPYGTNPCPDWADKIELLPSNIRYVLVLNNDFLITEPVDGHRLHTYANYAYLHNLAYVRLTPVMRNWFGRMVEVCRLKTKDLRTLQKWEPYYSSVDPALWRRDHLI